MQLQDLQNPCISDYKKKDIIYLFYHLKLYLPNMFQMWLWESAIGVLRSEVFQAFLMKKSSKLKLYDELLRVANIKKINLGFDSEKLPDKGWMVNILQKLDEKNQLFTKICDVDRVIGLTRDDLNLLKDLDTSIGRKKRLQFFKRTTEQVKKQQLTKAIKKQENLKKRLQRKKEDSERIEKQIKHYQIKIQQVNPQLEDQLSMKKQQKL